MPDEEYVMLGLGMHAGRVDSIGVHVFGFEEVTSLDRAGPGREFMRHRFLTLCFLGFGGRQGQIASLPVGILSELSGDVIDFVIHRHGKELFDGGKRCARRRRRSVGIASASCQEQN